MTDPSPGKEPPEPTYPWYAVVPDKKSDTLEQGDLIPDCVIGYRRVLPGEKGYTEGKDTYEESSLPLGVVLSQSCDLAAGKLQTIQICPAYTLDEFVKNDTSNYFRGTKAKEELRRGNQPSYHMLNECALPGYRHGLLVCDFRSLVSVPFGPFWTYATKVKPRVRLLPPYREHLAQALARFFMRVGLPTDIPPFK
jgi:hypothetical protein